VGGKRKDSLLKKKMADWWWRQEVSPQVAAIMSEVQVKANYGKWKEVEGYLKKLEEGIKKEEVGGGVVKLKVSRMHKEEEKKFRRRAFYDALYPIVLEYRFMPLQAMFIWYLQALRLVYEDKPPVDLLNVMRGWIRGWLSGGCTKEAEEKIKASIIAWVIGKCW
jgi:hypothetical protein